MYCSTNTLGICSDLMQLCNCRDPQFTDPGALSFQYKMQALLPTKVLACEAKFGTCQLNLCEISRVCVQQCMVYGTL